MKNKKLLIYLGIGLVVLVIFMIIGKKAGWIGEEYLTKVSTEQVEKRSIVEIITANGKVQPEVEIRLSPEVSGEIVALEIIEGQQVKEGQLLLKINPKIYLSLIDRMEATVNTSKSNLANSKAMRAQVKAQFKQSERAYNRSKKLWNEKAIADSEYESVLSAYEVAQANVEASEQSVNAAAFQVKSSEASLKEAHENLSKTTIYAPMSGTVSRLNVEKGERVVGTAQMAGTEVLRIANLNLMEVKVDVNENDIVRVSLNDTAIVEVDAYLGRKFRGLVTEIANSANTQGTSADQVTNFEVKIRILHESYKDLIPVDNPTYSPFRPGMSATVDIQTMTRYNILTIPIQAVTVRADSTGTAKDDENKIQEVSNSTVKDEKDKKKTEVKIEPFEVVFLYADGKVQMQKVKTGIQDNLYIEITKGLTDSSEVVVAPYSAIAKKLKHDMKVEKVEKEELFERKKE